MTENVTISDGRLQVARAAHKEDVDVDLSNVETVHYERGLNGEGGAIVIREKDCENETVIRVDEADAPELYSRIVDAVPADMVPSEESPVSAQRPQEADLAANNSGQGDAPSRQNRKSQKN